MKRKKLRKIFLANENFNWCINCIHELAMSLYDNIKIQEGKKIVFYLKIINKIG